MDYYQLLGVSKNASQEEIKKAYRSLAMKHHPDRGGDVNKFKEIQIAYDTLSNEQKRAEYDNPSPFGQGAGPGGFEFHFGGPGGFEQMFGHGSPFGDIFGFSRTRTPVNRAIQLQTAITLEDAFTGKELVASVNLPSGRTQTINIKIPQGIHDGTNLRLAGIGDDSVPNAPRGDILLNVHVQNHPTFRRHGDDLIVEHTINCFDAMLGSKVNLTGIDGKQLEALIPAGVQYDTVLGLNGQGMPNFNSPNSRGRLLIKIKVQIPLLTGEQQQKLKSANIL